MAISEIIGDHRTLLKALQNNLKGVGVDTSAFPIDHLGFRARSLDEFRAVCGQIEKYALKLGEIDVRNRPIGIYKLRKPLNYVDREISVVEIMAPAKGDRKFLRKLEHAEFVVSSLEKLQKEHPDTNFNTSNLRNSINPELILNFPNDANCKFHEKPLEELVSAL